MQGCALVMANFWCKPRSASRGSNMTYKRPSWHEYFIEMARLAATRATCPRRRVGAVLTRHNQILATGYNGAVRGGVHCDDVGCLMVDGHCVRTVHAEANAIIQCAVNGVSSVGATIYCTDFPCINCAKTLVQAGVAHVIYLIDYPDPNSAAVLAAGGVQLFQAIKTDEGYVLKSLALAEGDAR
jgi:dCMP deaminase